MRVQNAISAKKNMLLKDKTLEVLVEGISKGNINRLTGRTRSNKVVNFEGSKELIGKFVNVKITEPHTWSLIGRIEK
jgi:tRNA-2-methylthio-N6-dimethylallyladenosine synthase